MNEKKIRRVEPFAGFSHFPVTPDPAPVQTPRFAIDVEPNDGNIFSVIGATRKALRRAGATSAQIEEYTAAVKATPNYAEALEVTMQWVNLT